VVLPDPELAGDCFTSSDEYAPAAFLRTGVPGASVEVVLSILSDLFDFNLPKTHNQ